MDGWGGRVERTRVDESLSFLLDVGLGSDGSFEIGDGCRDEDRAAREGRMKGREVRQ